MKKKAILMTMMITVTVALGGCGGKQANTPSSGKNQPAAAADSTDITDSAATGLDDLSDAANTQKPTEVETDQDTEPAEAQDTGAQEVDSPEEETAEEEESPGAQRDLFADFIMGKSSARVSANFKDEMTMNDLGMKAGEEYSVNDIKDLVAQSNEEMKDVDPRVSYAPVTVGDRILYAFELYYETNWDGVSEMFVLSDHSGELEYLFGIDGWSRRSLSINENGVVFDSGSNGAGSHISDIYAPDRSLVYQKISRTEENFWGWDFYDDKGQPVEGLNKTMNAMNEADTSLGEKIAFYRETIDQKDYYYFLGVDKITQDTVDLIDKVAANNGFKFDGKATADEAREAYAQTLGAAEAIKVQAEPQWKSLN